MEILRENFEEHLPKVMAAIQEADYISYDYEFTGLFNEKDRGLVDSPSERYQRHRRQCVKFLPVQCGICTFKYNETRQSYSYAAFNVYLFPHSLEPMSLPDKCFLLQSSSIDFLVKHEFDFNKAFYHGVGFVSALETEERLQKADKRFEEMCEDLNGNKSPIVIPIPKNLEEFMEEKMTLVRDFIAKQPGPEEDIRFFNMNSFQRKLLFVHLPKLSDSLIIESEFSPKEGAFLVIKMNAGGPRNLRKEYEEKREKLKKQARTQAGFSRIIDSISKSKAILIGHNQGIDLLHTLHHFISPLPAAYEDFKTFATSTFPRLVDTKTMASSEAFKEHFPATHLSFVYERTETEPFKTVKLETEGEELCGEKFHDAAYDAFCTGRSFLAMLEFLAEAKKIEPTINEMKELLLPFFHKIPVMDDLVIKELNLGGADEIPEAVPVFHATFPNRWRADDVKKAFASLLSDSNALRIYWIDQQSAWIRLFEDHASEAVEKLSDSKIPFTVISLPKWREGGDEVNNQPRAKKRRASDKANDEPAVKSSHQSSFDVPEEW